MKNPVKLARRMDNTHEIREEYVDKYSDDYLEFLEQNSLRDSTEAQQDFIDKEWIKFSEFEFNYLAEEAEKGYENE